MSRPFPLSRCHINTSLLWSAGSRVFSEINGLGVIHLMSLETFSALNRDKETLLFASLFLCSVKMGAAGSGGYHVFEVSVWVEQMLLQSTVPEQPELDNQ